MPPSLLLLLLLLQPLISHTSHIHKHSSKCPQPIHQACHCHINNNINNDTNNNKDNTIFCSSLNSSSLSWLSSPFSYHLSKERSYVQHFDSLHIERSSLGPIFNVKLLADLRQMTSLTLVFSQIERLINLEQLSQLEVLNVSNNAISKLDGLNALRKLQVLDVSHNRLHVLDGHALSGLQTLHVLDVAHNLLDENLDPDTFQLLPNTLTILNIQGNPWKCSPLLAWLHPWLLRRPLLSSSSWSSVRCRYGDSPYDGQLVLVMRYYSTHVLPTCPRNCTCQLTSVQERLVVAKERVYSVQVDCAHANLRAIPPLPRHTRKVDLRHNQLDDQAFLNLRVDEHNYDEVDDLNLDFNKLNAISDKLLDMKLGLGFSARNNSLTTKFYAHILGTFSNQISYDFSQHLVKMTAVIRLANNPWRCTCRSQITDLNLVAKVSDRQELVCGPGSDLLLVGQKISELDPNDLCPPESTDEFRELVLQVLCVVLALLILVVLARLAFDCYNYKHNNRLPWIALKMP